MCGRIHGFTELGFNLGYSEELEKVCHNENIIYIMKPIENLS